MESSLDNCGSWLARWAASRGDQLAIDDGLRRLSYRDLDERSARLAAWLVAKGVAKGDRVAILLANQSAYLESVFAAARIGAIAVPGNTRLSVPELKFILEDCQPAALVFGAPLADAAGKAAHGVVPTSHQLCVGGPDDPYENALGRSEPERRIVPVAADDPMILMYTSGTTGKPKGALLPHRKTLFNSLNAQLFFGIRGDDRVLVATPLYHSLGLCILSLPVLYCGASLFLHPGFDPARVWKSVEDERLTYFGGVPTQYRRLHAELEGSDGTSGESRGATQGGVRDLSSLRFLFTAGAAIPVDLVHAFERRGLTLKQGYGQTETSILCCLDASDAIRKAGSVGQPVFHAEVRVVPRAQLDRPPEEWQDVAPGETGEIVVRGPIAMLGYWQRPDATAEAFRGDWLRTTDLARVDAEGFVTLVGRARDMIISGGENVYPAEIEATYEQHPAISEIAVIGVPDDEWGEVGQAHVVLHDGAELDPNELARWGRERLAAFKIPKAFLSESSLPRTMTGKVLKYRLRDRC